VFFFLIILQKGLLPQLIRLGPYIYLIHISVPRPGYNIRGGKEKWLGNYSVNQVIGQGLRGLKRKGKIIPAFNLGRQPINQRWCCTQRSERRSSKGMAWLSKLSTGEALPMGLSHLVRARTREGASSSRVQEMHNSGQPSCWLQPSGVQVRPTKGEVSPYFCRSGEKREEPENHFVR
jgi:hypothetical protein